MLACEIDRGKPRSPEFVIRRFWTVDAGAGPP